MSPRISPPAQLPPALAWAVFGGIVLVGLILKGLYLGAQDIAMDEPFTLFWAQHPLGEIWELAKNENNPPLHFVLEHFWIKLFGIGPISVRFPSLVFSCLTAGILFWTGNQNFGWKSGLGAALLYTLSTEHIYYSHEARAYSLLCLLTALALQLQLGVLRSPARWRPYLWLALVNSLLIYTHFLGFWVLLAQSVGFLFLNEKRKALPRMLAMYGLVALAYLPNLPALLLRVQSVREAGGTWVEKPHWSQLYGHVNIFLNGKWGTLGLCAVVVIGVYFLVSQRRWREFLKENLEKPHMLMALAWFGLIYFGMFAQSLIFSPTFIPRYLLFSSIPLFLVLGNVGAWLLQGRAGAFLAIGGIALAMLPGLQLNPPNHRDMKGLIEAVHKEKSDEIPLLLCPGYFDKAFVYHDDISLFETYSEWESTMFRRKIFSVYHWAEVPTSELDSAQKLIFLDADSKFTLPENGILEHLEGIFPVQRKLHVEGIFDLYFFSR